MQTQRAILIQDIRDYIIPLNKVLLETMSDEHAANGMTAEDALHWIIDHQIQELYNLFISRKFFNDWGYYCLYVEVCRKLPYTLARWTSHYIKAPNIYGDNCEIQTHLDGTDLIIKYTRVHEFSI